MAYNFIPKSVKEIADKTQLGNNRGQIVTLFSYLVESYDVSDPLAIDPAKGSSVKVSRRLNGIVNLADIKRKLQLNLTLSFGNGSRGGMGAANKGNLFEGVLVDDLNHWVAGEDIKDQSNKRFVYEFTTQYSLDRAKDIQVLQMSQLNQKRPLVFSGGSVYVGGPNYNIGKTVTDITVNADKQPIYLSLKYGNKVTFFNAGVARVLSERDISSGLVQNQQGQAILDIFGIDNQKFCSVFNSYGTGSAVKAVDDTFRKINRTGLQNLIKSGIGFGYHLVHKVGNSIHHFPITQTDLNRFSTPQSCTVYYGGMSPSEQAKRVDMIVETPKFVLQFNIRSKTGGVYPTHLMSDYTIKH